VIKKVLIKPITTEYSDSIIAEPECIAPDSSAVFLAENAWQPNISSTQVEPGVASSLSASQHSDIARDIQCDQQVKADMQRTLVATQQTLAATTEPPLGYAIGQLSGLFILAENKLGLMLVDMHAAHERVIYEKMKAAYEQQGIISQNLLVPIKVSLNRQELDTASEFKSIYEQLGFAFHL